MTQAKGRAPAKPKPAPHLADHKSHRHDETPAEQTAMHGQFCWNELMTRDLARVKAFYGPILGWSFEAMPMADGSTYWLIKKPGHPKGLGGVFEMKGPHFDGMPEAWCAYIAVDDVDGALKHAVKAGAQVMKEPFDVPDVGRIACLRQPGGAMIYWMTPRPPTAHH